MTHGPETRKRAARLVWEGSDTLRQIAARCGISRRTLAYWKKRRDFRALVAIERAAWQAARGQGVPARPSFGPAPPPPATRVEAECREFIAAHWGPGRELHRHAD